MTQHQDSRPPETSPENAEIFHLIVENVTDYAIFMTDAAGVVVSWNPGVERLLGYAESEIVGASVAIIFTPEDRAAGAHVKEMETAARTGRAEDKRWHVRRDGSRFWANGLVMPLKSGDGALRGFAKVMRDDTPQKQAEDKLRFLVALNQTLQPLVAPEEIMSETARMLGEHLGANRCAYAEAGADEDSVRITGDYVRDTFSIVGEYKMSDFGAEALRLMRAGEPYVVRDAERDSRVAPENLEAYRQTEIAAVISVPLHKNGRFVAGMAVHQKKPRDWTADEIELVELVVNRCWESIERARANKNLRESAARYQTLFDSIDEGFCTCEVFFDENGKALDYRLLEVNPSFEKLSGISARAATSGKTIREVVPNLEEHWFEIYGRVARTGESVRFEQGSDALGSWFDVYAFRVGAPEERKVAILFNNITESKQAEQALRESETQLRTLADSIPQLAWMAQPDGFIFWYNRKWYEYTGTTPEEMAGWGWQSVHDAEMLPKVVERWKRSIETGEPFEMEFPLKNADGEFRWFLTRVNPLLDSSGNLTLWFGTNTDIHERRIAQMNAEFLASITDDLASLKTIDQMMQSVGAKVGAFLNLSLCAFVEINETEDTAAVTYNWHRKEAPSIVGVYRLKEYLTEDFQRAGRAGEVFVVRDVENDPRTDAENYAGLKIASFVCTPLVRDGAWRFMLNIHDSKPRDWREDEIELVRELTTRVWNRLERARAEEERERLLQSERVAREEAEQANRLKDEFLATLSHELRTPLNAILGWSQMLQNRDLDEADAKKALATIERSARAQNQLIEDLLDVSRIITGKLRLDVRAVDLPSVIVAATDAARPAADAKNIRLQTLLDPHAGPISGDPDRLQQIVWNLLSNAIKFTDKNGRVQVRLERINSHVEITVADTGKGIEPDFLPHVFDRFRQSDGSMTRRHGGLGLGLAIVRQLVELHGGSVSVQSAGEGQGATFMVNFPLLPVRREPENAAAPRVHPKAATGATQDCPPELDRLRVLLVDDEADSRDLLNVVLESCGATVTTASSAAEALDLIKNERFDVIVSDIGMPEEDGFSLVGKIRELPDERGGDTPAIALTAYARAEDRVQALRSGFQMHVAKPVEPVELVAVVANLAGRMRKPHRSDNT